MKSYDSERKKEKSSNKTPTKIQAAEPLGKRSKRACIMYNVKHKRAR